jgi:hypothetical protein
MNLSEIKDIIQREGGKIVIVENDKPQLIIMSFEEYKGKIEIGDRSSPVQAQVSPPAPELISPSARAERQEPRINPYSPPRAEGDSPPVGGEGLTIDDLPL